MTKPSRRTNPRDSVRERLRAAGMRMPAVVALVDSERQTLRLMRNGTPEREYTVSTSAWGMGNQEGSNKTPPGIHRICEKIGAGAPRGRIFRSRRDTGIDWTPGNDDENLILTRILRLEGLEDGVNRGPGIDSYDRYIYIHGTNREDRVGTPLSHGCVVMSNRDIVDLFDRVEEGTLVIID